MTKTLTIVQDDTDTRRLTYAHGEAASSVLTSLIIALTAASSCRVFERYARIFFGATSVTYREYDLMTCVDVEVEE